VQNYRNKKIILFSFLGIILFGNCQQQRKNIKEDNCYVDTTYHDNGAIKEIITYKDSLEDGPYREYYSNGQIKTTGQYLYGKEVGWIVSIL
jgi:antitoxin component YwqK of YwqJK toxin-antitoxin module